MHDPQIRGKVLVTGGAGFIGSHLVEELLGHGAEVTVVDNFRTGRVENLAAVRSWLDLVTGDLGDLVRSGELRLNRFRYVFHLAANAYIPPSVEDPPYDFEANLHNTFLMLEDLRRHPGEVRLINVSSAAVYGNPVRLPIQESDPTVPISPYGVSKLAGERYAAVFSQLYGIRSTSLRFFSVYGPRQRKQVVFDLLRKLRANPGRLEVLGDGSQARDFSFVTDVVRAVILAATRAPGRGEVYNIASGTTHSIAALVAAWSEVCGLAPEVVYDGQTRPGDAERWVVDITGLKRLGFEARVPLHEGLAFLRDWYDAAL
jgi:UDP-glucose 4-epimerase